jgi:methylated-DNA-protein-cysteine methyltransferase-like protein
VINANGKISMPRESLGFDRQKERLQEEDVVVTNGRIDLKEFRWQP